jgi:uncharacterized membrane protein (UPF0127 family)
VSAGAGWHQRLERLEVVTLPDGLRVHVARRARERRLGLARLDDLDPRHALRLEPCRAVHTFGMRFALDLIWLARDGAVLRVDRAVPVRRHRLCLRARSVVETRAGEADHFLRAGLGYSAGR